MVGLSVVFLHQRTRIALCSQNNTHNLRKGTVCKTLFRSENRSYVHREHSQTRWGTLNTMCLIDGPHWLVSKTFRNTLSPPAQGSVSSSNEIATLSLSPSTCLSDPVSLTLSVSLYLSLHLSSSLAPSLPLSHSSSLSLFLHLSPSPSSLSLFDLSMYVPWEVHSFSSEPTTLSYTRCAHKHTHNPREDRVTPTLTDQQSSRAVQQQMTHARSDFGSKSRGWCW